MIIKDRKVAMLVLSAIPILAGIAAQEIGLIATGRYWVALALPGFGVGGIVLGYIQDWLQPRRERRREEQMLEGLRRGIKPRSDFVFDERVHQAGVGRIFEGDPPDWFVDPRRAAPATSTDTTESHPASHHPADPGPPASAPAR